MLKRDIDCVSVHSNFNDLLFLLIKNVFCYVVQKTSISGEDDWT